MLKVGIPSSLHGVEIAIDHPVKVLCDGLCHFMEFREVEGLRLRVDIFGEGDRSQITNRRLVLVGVLYNFGTEIGALDDPQVLLVALHIAGIFVDPMQAEGIDNYIEFGYDNCECPDDMEELYETCPALMSKVDKCKDRKDAQTRVTIEFLDRMMDMVIQEQLTARPLVLEKKEKKLSRAERKAQAYEENVVEAMKAVDLESGMFADKVVDASATGPDAEFLIDGKPYFLEIKLDKNAQMGDVSIYYNPKGNGTFKVKGETKNGMVNFGFAKPERFNEEIQDVIYGILNT